MYFDRIVVWLLCKISAKSEEISKSKKYECRRTSKSVAQLDVYREHCNDQTTVKIRDYQIELSLTL